MLRLVALMRGLKVSEGAKASLGLLVQLRKSAALCWSETVPIFSTADVMSTSGGLASSMECGYAKLSKKASRSLL